MRRLFAWVFVVSLLTACEQRHTAARATPVVAEADSLTIQPPPAAAPQPDTTDASRVRLGYLRGQDTAFYVGPNRYRLLLRAQTDSTKPLIAVTDGSVGALFAADTSTFAKTGRVRGYEGGPVITLLDQAGRQVFRRKMRKADFYDVVSRDIVTVSEPVPPVFMGYHAPSQSLAFSLDIAIPYSDVWQRCVLLLGLDGRVRRLATSYLSNWSAPDCMPRLLPDGTVLSCQELLSATGRRISLLKPRSELVAAFPLTDSTLFVAYRYGVYRPQPVNAADTLPDASVSAAFNNPEWVPDRRMRHAPTAFVLNLKGQSRQAVRFTGLSQYEMGYSLARRYLWQTHCYYLLEEDGSLLALDKQRPTAITRLPFRQMRPFRTPQLPTEVALTLGGYRFYVDAAQPRQVRYQRLPPREAG